MIDPLVLNPGITTHSTAVAPRVESRGTGDASNIRHILVRVEGELPDGRVLRAPVFVQAHLESDGSVVISDDEISAYGVGDTIGEAVADYMAMLVEMFDELTADEWRLSRYLRAELTELRNRIDAS